MSGADQRLHPRIEANIYIDYTGQEVILFHRIENISLGGLSIRAPSVEKVGTTVELVINIPETEKRLDCLGEVVWSHEEDEGRMGIKFLNLDGENRNTLKEYLSRTDPFYAK